MKVEAERERGDERERGLVYVCKNDGRSRERERD